MSYELDENDAYCIVCNRTVTDTGVRVMYYGVPIDEGHEGRVNFCGDHINLDELKRMYIAAETGEGDDWYHLEIHELKGED